MRNLCDQYMQGLGPNLKEYEEVRSEDEQRRQDDSKSSQHFPNWVLHGYTSWIISGMSKGRVFPETHWGMIWGKVVHKEQEGAAEAS